MEQLTMEDMERLVGRIMIGNFLAVRTLENQNNLLKTQLQEMLQKANEKSQETHPKNKEK